MLLALVPDVLQPAITDVPMGIVDFDGVGKDVDLTNVGFYVPPYLGPRLTLELMEEMPSLEVVQLLTAGFDTALAYVPEHVTLCNAVGVHESGTAELALALVLASLRGIDDYARAMPQGLWIHDCRPSLVDRKVIVVGAGGVGRAIADRLIPFEVEVTLIAQSKRPGVLAISELPKLLPQADIVILAVPLSAGTKGLVNNDFLNRMREGALLVNVARGAVVDTDALVQHVQQGHIRAALDVTDPEPLPIDHPLWRTPGILISPHVGGDSTAFVPRAKRLVDSQLRLWKDGSPLEHVVLR